MKTRGGSGESGDGLKISAKRFVLPESATRAGWKFERRPGGWLIAISPAGERLRMAGVELRGKLSFNFPAAGSGFGEVIGRPHAGGAGGGVTDNEFAAQFPGKVRKILVAEGSRVAAGEALLLVEAMKMEFAIKAPVSGKVTRLRVKEGQQLQPGDRFLDFEPDNGE